MKETLDEVAVSGTAFGPADVRDTPHVKPPFPDDDDEAEAEEEDPWIGRTLSNVYEILEKIGEGGMGSVYLARHVHLKKDFAVKVLVDTIAKKGNAVERLKQEAMAAANIDHESIVDVVNFDQTEDGAVFIVMELLKGESLADAVGRGPISLHRALPITFQICRALHQAHERGIVHRDLKPENVFLTEKSGRTLAKILDFGISKVKSEEAEQVRMTKTGQLVGTPLYMSPEQARGETEIDRRVDIYAMGVMLFEMITGTPPFEGRNYFELLWKHGNEEPPSMRDKNPNVYFPDAVDAVVLRALAKERDERFQTMEALEQALREAAPEVPEFPAAPSLPPERPAKGEAPKKELDAIARAPTEQVSSLDEAAATPDPEAPAARNPLPIVAVALGGLLVVGAIGYAVMGTDDPDTSPPVADAPPEPVDVDPIEVDDPPEDEPEVEPPQGIEPPPDIAPPRVSVHLTSRPAGATVRVGDRELGTTPLVTALDASDEPVTLTYERDGYLAQTMTVVPVDGVQVPEVTLRRRRRATPNGEGTGGGTLPIKTGM